jgi:galactoside O-acetyltransferase
MQDYSTLSSKVAIYSSNSDYSGEYMISPLLPIELIKNYTAAVVIEKHALIGSGAIILPGVTIYEGAVVGALSLVKEDCESFYIYGGVPAHKIKKRSRSLLNLEFRI